MTTGTDYGKLYNQAYAKYGQGDYDAALALTEQMEQEFPNDVHLFLLQGNIYYGLGQYDHACQKYEFVLARSAELGDQPQVIEYAHQGLERAQQYMAQLLDPELALAETEGISVASRNAQAQPEPAVEEEDDGVFDWQAEADALSEQEDFNMDGVDWDSAIFSDEDLDFGEPTLGKSGGSQENPFEDSGGETNFNPNLRSSPTFQMGHNPFDTASEDFPSAFDEETDSFPVEDENDFASPQDRAPSNAEQTFMMSGTLNMDEPSLDDFSSVTEDNESGMDADWGQMSMMDQRTVQAPPMEFEEEEGIENWDDLKDSELEGLSQFNLTDISQELPDSGMFPEDMRGATPNYKLNESNVSTKTSADGDSVWLPPSMGEDSGLSELKPRVEVQQGKLAGLINAPLGKKQLVTAAVTGVVSTFAILLVAGGTALLSPKTATTATQPQPQHAQKPVKKGANVFLLALVGGASSFAAVFVLSELLKRHIKRTLDDITVQLDSLYGGNYNVKATVFGSDEFGNLANRFNIVAREVHTKTSEALARATEVEQAREDLQRQVIRLLDDVEGANNSLSVDPLFTCKAAFLTCLTISRRF
jgi:twitching motility protein PilJ